MKALCALAVGSLGLFVVACGGTTVEPSGSGGSTGSSTSTGTSTGSDTGGATTGTGTATSTGTGINAGAMACADVVKERCDLVDKCTGGVAITTNYGTAAVCNERGVLACLANFAAPGTGTTAATLEACAMTSETCADFLDNNPPAVCLPQPGGVAAGGACGASAQCQSAFCAVPKNAICGVCAAKPKAGDSCASVGCGQGLTCTKASELCVVPAAAGGACGKDLPCGNGLSCIGASGMMMGQCLADATAMNAPCDAKVGPDCEKNLGLYCSPLTKTCAAVTFADATQPCGVLAGGVAACKAGAQCLIPAGQKSGTCIAPAADGAKCDTVAGPPCLRLAECVVTVGSTSGVCTQPDPTSCK
jgi:hypothetical protein